MPAESRNNRSAASPEPTIPAPVPTAQLSPEQIQKDLLRRLSFLRLDAEDQRRLQALLPVFEQYAAEFAEQFYEHLFQHEQAARFLRDPALVERLKKSQAEHLRSMLQAAWTIEYATQRRKVGDAHAHVGIEPPLFLGSYADYLEFYLAKLAEREGDVPQSFVDSLSSLFRAVILDCGLTLDAYFVELTRKLRHALDMVWQANTQLRQFAQLTSHDLKTPLATMTNLCEEVLDEFGTQMPEEARKLIEAAKNRAFKMSQTIDELLSSTLSNRPADDDEEFASEHVIQEAAERLKQVLDEKNIQLNIQKPLPWVRGDRVQVREAFYNLLSNAAKFIDKRPGHIDITVECSRQDVLFCVADNGSGIPGDELERIFVPFRRLPAHREKPGSGLGLYFTKSLIEQQGGRIWAESELGRGSRFFVMLHRNVD